MPWLWRLAASRYVAHVSLCRDRILVAESEITDMIEALPESGLASVAGVVLASSLLDDGPGPVYNKHCIDSLAGAVQKAPRLIRNPIAPVGSSAHLPWPCDATSVSHSSFPSRTSTGVEAL